MFIKQLVNFNDTAYILKDQRPTSKFLNKAKTETKREAVEWWRQYVNADVVFMQGEYFLFLQLIEEAQIINDTEETNLPVS